MLLAVQRWSTRQALPVRLAVDQGFGTYEDRARYGLWLKVRFPKVGRSAISLRLTPRAIQERYGILTEDRITAVIDASGFAFSDQLGPQRTERFADDVERWKRQRKPVVLLPQALGPFKTERVRSAFQRVVWAADLIYARDAVSQAHLAELDAGRGNLRLAPDFTILVEGVRHPDDAHLAGRVCLVPNTRMLENVSEENRGRYLPFLKRCLSCLAKLELMPYFLLHSSGDDDVFQELQATVSSPLDIVRASDPIRIKGMLGTASLVIGSRFHALVGALDQAVPSIATGWSHKYEMLFRDYGCPEHVVPLTATQNELSTLISVCTQGASRASLVDSLSRASEDLRSQIRKMWTEVDAVLGLNRV